MRGGVAQVILSSHDLTGAWPVAPRACPVKVTPEASISASAPVRLSGQHRHVRALLDVQG